MKRIIKKQIPPIGAGVILAAAVMLSACKDGNPPDAKGKATLPNENSAAPALVKILPPVEAFKMASAQPGDKDGPHDAKEKLCYICNPKLRDSKRLWCNEHDRYEERCFICHPEVQEKGRLFCREHFLYEDECYICHPEILPAVDKKPQANSGGASAPGGLMCKEHKLLEVECGICHPELLKNNNLKVRFGSKESAVRAGVSAEPIVVGQLVDQIEVYAELAFNENRLTEIALPVNGIVKSVQVDLGSMVEEGAVLATVSSVEISSAVGDFLRAMTADELAGKALEREQKLSKQKISSQQELDKAEARLQTTQVEKRQNFQQLLTLGFDSTQIKQLAQHPDEEVVLKLRAPFSGEIAERNAVQGSWQKAGASLFKLVDTRSIWAFLSIPESDLQRIKLGQVVKLLVESRPGEVFEGKLTWIAPSIDSRTRTARARAEFENPNGELKASMFARAHIINRKTKGLLLPKNAIQDIEGQSVAFVRLADDLFDVRLLKMGIRGRDQVEVISGVNPGEQVVTRSSFVLKSQFLISRLGAGCVHE